MSEVKDLQFQSFEDLKFTCSNFELEAQRNNGASKNSLKSHSFSLQNLCSIVSAVVKLVSKAKKPVAVLGSQSTLPPVATEKLKSALEVFVVLLKSFCLLLNV